jgi:hypothetical protein
MQEPRCVEADGAGGYFRVSSSDGTRRQTIASLPESICASVTVIAPGALIVRPYVTVDVNGLGDGLRDSFDSDFDLHAFDQNVLYVRMFQLVTKPA